MLRIPRKGLNVSWKSLQIIGVGHDEREEKAGRVCPTVGQTMAYHL